MHETGRKKEKKMSLSFRLAKGHGEHVAQVVKESEKQLPLD